ncbi:adhesion G protein-coupled receptor L3 isoform X12 [Pipistrellus kuhlii]|uniref:adhesion G protein-coupled receptor L3 isoform X12 n=1 Tax=Pipistrellus kuhlii TaxID=59472 RepID=UPI001E274D92|nr:adhesion G protein-coupled receptor L3 isoform X12 [Pipistrellus kuhlii]
MPDFTTMWPSQLLLFTMLLAPIAHGGKHIERHPALAAPLRHAERNPGGALPPRHLLQQPTAERATAHRGPGPRGAARGVRGPGAQGAQIPAQAFSRAPIPMAVVRRELSCESYPIELRCPGTDVIMIESANYGRTDDKICDSDPAQMENIRCYLPDAYKIMSQRCNNRTQCAVVAGPDVFPDPCPGTYKYLEVQYECVPYIFLCPGLLRGVYQSEHLFESDHQSGAWCKDPLQASDKIYYMPWTPYRTDTLTEYSSKDDFIAGRPTTTYKLPHRVDGTGFVVYDGALFFNKERTRNIVKFDLRTRIKSGEAIIANANYHDTSPYRWGGKSDIDLAVDENGLWVIYATEQNNGKIVISQLNPYTLRIEGTWDTAYDKRSASNAFMICGILYVVKSVYEDDDNEATGNKIDYIYNTDQSKDSVVDVPFPNSYQYIAAVDYNPRDNLLYVWNNYHVVKYSLDFGPLDSRSGQAHHGQVSYISPPIHLDSELERPPVREISTTGPFGMGSTTTSTTLRTTTLSAARSTTPSVSGRRNRSTSTPSPAVEVLDDTTTHLPSAPSQIPAQEESCEAVEAREITWFKTRQGQTAKQPCPTGTIGVSTYLCLAPDGIWDPQGPDLSNCSSPWINHITQKLKSGETAANIARELAEQTRNHLHAGDITYSVRAMDQLVGLLDVQLRNLTPGGKDSAARSLNKLQKRERSCRAYVQAMVETVNNLLQPQALNAWRDLTTSDQLRAATMLLDTVEESAFVLADNLLKTDIVRENTDNIQLEVARLSTEGNLEDLKFPESMGHGSTIQLSANTLKQNGRNGEIRVAFVLYNNLGPYLSTENASMKLGTEAMSTNHSVIVNSPVITAAINKEFSNKVYLADPVVFTVKHIKQSEENFNPNCSFWSYSKRTMTGYWSTQGCRLLTTNKTHTTCSCNHLTNFAVLMAHVEVKSDRNTIHKNLCISLFVAELLFLIGINRTDQPIACAVFAALLHFFFLAAFTWMFLEGVQLYIMLVEVFESEHSRRKYFYLVGYGMPALIVAVSAAVDYRSYGTDKVCWLRLDTYFIWSFIGPATLIIMLNVIFLGIALYKMFHHTAILKPESGCLDNIKSWVIGAIALLCLLGLTWAFGLMYINESTVIMAYLFTIFNSLQGMFIFIFHCVLQKKVRKEYGKCLRTHCCSGKSTESSIGSGKTSGSRTPGRYSTGSQSRIRRMWNDTVRKQSESSFITGDINSSASLNREGLLNNARDTSVMDTLPLNGNHANSYSIAGGEYHLSNCVQILDRGYTHTETTALEKKILKELTSNYIPSYLNNHERSSCEQSRNLMNKLVNNLGGGSGGGGGGGGEEDAIVLDDAASFSHEDGLGLELIHEESDAPLLPPRMYSVAENHQVQQPHHYPRRRIPQDHSESFFPLLTNEHTEEELPSPPRDARYTSMPALAGAPAANAAADGVPAGTQAEPPPPRAGDAAADDVYYKSMPNLGSRSHVHQLHTYYQLGRGSSDGFIVPPNKDGSPPEGGSARGPAHLVTSL